MCECWYSRLENTIHKPFTSRASLADTALPSSPLWLCRLRVQHVDLYRMDKPGDLALLPLQHMFANGH